MTMNPIEKALERLKGREDGDTEEVPAGRADQDAGGAGAGVGSGPVCLFPAQADPLGLDGEYSPVDAAEHGTRGGASILQAAFAPAGAPKPGIYYGVKEAEYRAWPYFSQSEAKGLLRSPMHWAAWKKKPRQTEVMLVGSLVDCYLTSRSEWTARYVLRPATYRAEKTTGRGEAKATTVEIKKFNTNATVCAEKLAELEASGKTVITRSQAKTAVRTGRAAKKHPIVAKWLFTADRQVSVVWDDTQTGVRCKGRYDLLAVPKNIAEADQYSFAIPDLKCTFVADREAFRRTATIMGYAVQAGMYSDAYSVLHQGLTPIFYWVAIETEHPHGVAVYPVGPSTLATGLKTARKAMLVWKDVQAGKMYGYPVYQDELDILPYAIDHDEENFNV